MTGQLTYPQMREELIGYLQELSDWEYQKSNWLPENAPDGIPRSQFDYSVHFFYDDTELANDPTKCIDWFLADQTEVQLISEVVKAIDAVFKKYGLDLTDAEYISKPEWQNIIETSKSALIYIEKVPGV